MSYIMTYSSLLQDVRSYLERGKVADAQVYAQLPHILAMSEKALIAEFVLQGFERFVTDTMAPGVFIIAKPDLWRETFSFKIGINATSSVTGFNTRRDLFPRGQEYCQNYWPDPTQLAQPKFYGDYGYSNWIIAPTPVLAYPFEVGYYELVQPLDEINTTNWITQYAPNLILYRVLLDCQPYLKNDDRIPTWQQFYDEAASGLQTKDASKQSDKSVKRGA